MAKLQKNERIAKGKLIFLFISKCKVNSAKARVTKKHQMFGYFMEKLYFCSKIRQYEIYW